MQQVIICKRENTPPLPSPPGASSTERVSLCLCHFTCAPTGLKGGALRRHAPRAGAAASGQHDRELVQRVGLQAHHHVVQAGGVGHLGGETGEDTRQALLFSFNLNNRFIYYSALLFSLFTIRNPRCELDPQRGRKLRKNTRVLNCKVMFSYFFLYLCVFPFFHTAKFSINYTE